MLFDLVCNDKGPWISSEQHKLECLGYGGRFEGWQVMCYSDIYWGNMENVCSCVCLFHLWIKMW